MVDKQGEANMATTPLLDKVLERAAAKGFSRDNALINIAEIVDHRKSPYDAAKHWDVLVDNSAEDFMIQFMSTFNEEIYRRY
jgi:hypothetical protein